MTTIYLRPLAYTNPVMSAKNQKSLDSVAYDDFHANASAIDVIESSGLPCVKVQVGRTPIREWLKFFYAFHSDQYRILEIQS